MRYLYLSLQTLTLWLLLVSSNLHSANGAYMIGYGTKSRGMAGISIALPQDALVSLTNPAGMVWIGNRVDANIAYLHTKYWEEISGNAFGKNGHADLNTFRNVGSAEAGYNHMITSRFSLGATVAPLAGGIVHHRKRLSDPAGQGPHKISVAFGALSPCFATRIGCNHSIGAAVDLVVGLIDVQGFESIQINFGSASPSKVTNNGWDIAPGVGVRLGWLTRATPRLRIGAAYRSKTYMMRFKKYEGFLTPRGKVNLPQRIDIGAAYDLGCSTTVAVDIGKVYYKQIRTWSGPAFDATKPRWGAPGGPGLGWNNQTIMKAGIAHKFCALSSNFTGRLGLNYSPSPIRRTRTNNNNSTPATTRYHVTTGLSWKQRCGAEWSLAYGAGLQERIRGTDASIPTATGGGRSDIYSLIHRLEIGWGCQL
ncbi:Uncharacterized protein SCG7086_AC_00210 [Chlamydiales bacterium SCGC AG-110-P3]|nr:Uncharacterized protein SCG7086_AC_00210 [Chlamydiales bacterium SCGC AG-110-P3]